MNKTTIVNAFASQPFVAIERNTLDILGTSGNRAHASAIGASHVGDGNFRVIDLSDAAGLETACVHALDIDGAMIAQYARGLTVADIAKWLKDSHNHGFLSGETVADRLRKALGNLSRVKARRWCAEQIFTGAVG